MHMKCITNLDGVEYADESESPDMVTCDMNVLKPVNKCKGI